MPNTAAASILDAHEDRLQRVEQGITGLSIKVTELGIKQDFHHQIQQEQNQRILEKIDGLSEKEERHEKHLEKMEHTGEKKSGWLELVPVKFFRKYFIHICVALVGAIGHKGWQMLWELLK